jgi:uncharacterized protein (DUF433 family)
MHEDEVKIFGRYIVADPRISHGQLTFRGTRILVRTVLDQVARGLAWETIVTEWGDDVPMEAIAEAVRLAREALFVSVNESRLDPLVTSRLVG